MKGSSSFMLLPLPLAILMLISSSKPVQSFVSNIKTEQTYIRTNIVSFYKKSIIDVEFEEIQNENKPRKKTLIQLIQEIKEQKLQNEEEELRMPFIEPLGNSYIDCKMLFGVTIDNVPVIIATPYDHAVAICCINEKEEDIRFLSPDNPAEAQEFNDVFAIAQKELSNQIDSPTEKLTLLKTPRTLTIRGDLLKYVDVAWESEKQKMNEILNSKNDENSFNNNKENKNELSSMNLLEELLQENSAEDEEYFEKTMKEALGDDYITLDDLEDMDTSSIFASPEVEQLFNETSSILNNIDVTNKNEMEKLLKELLGEEVDEDHDHNSIPTISSTSIREDATAEKLLTFQLQDTKKMYSLVRMTQPFVIIGREDANYNMRKILLTQEEMDVVLPRLEDISQQDEFFSKLFRNKN